MHQSRTHLYPSGTDLKQSISLVRTSLQILAFTGLVSLTSHLHSQSLTESVDDLTQSLAKACPKIWEDLGEKMDSDFAGDPWVQTGDDAAALEEADKADYISHLASVNEAPADEAAETLALAEISVIVGHCTAARTALLSKYYSHLPQDVVAAMASLDYEPGEYVDGFLIGDVRLTTRDTPAPGWFFLTGQSIGSASSSADLSGDDYKALYEIATSWDINLEANNPDIGTWGSGGKAIMPNPQGRSIAAHSNPANVGHRWGNNNKTLSISNMPSHNHTAQNVPNHAHTTDWKGNHSHDLWSSAYAGGNPGAYRYFEGKGRPNYQYTIFGATENTGSHQHNVNGGGSHTPIINHKGGGAKFSLWQPSIYFRAEIKYK